MDYPDWRAAYHGRRVLVLGASGFIGRWVARALARAGAELELIVRSRAQADPILASFSPRGTIHEADLRDLPSTRQLLERLAPAVVFNLAGYGVDPEEKVAGEEDVAALLNAELPALIAQSLAESPPTTWAGRRIVHVGSVFEYGNIGGHLDETSTPTPTGLYGRSKLEGTRKLAQACAATGVPGLTARLCQVYGPGEHTGRLLPMLLAARSSHVPLELTEGTQRKDFTYVEDVAQGLLRLGLSTGPAGQVVNLATGTLTTVREFVLVTAHLLRLDTRLLNFIKPLSANELEHDEVAVGRLLELTGWRPTTTVAEGVRNTVEFLDRADSR